MKTKTLYTGLLIAALLLIFHSAGAYASQEYAPISNRLELIEHIRQKVKTLEPEAYVSLLDYSEESYNADWCELFPLESISMHGTQTGRTAKLTYELKYTQSEKILHSLQGGKIVLSEKESVTAKKVREIFKEIIKEGMTEYDKQLAIHDYLVLNVAYDKSITPTDDSYTPYGALVIGKAVCQGYTDAADILLSLADIENGTLSGIADGQDHVWNIVKIGGDFYHMDVTWDAGLILDDGSRALSHAYFNITDTEAEQDHSWKKALQLEKFGKGCTADIYNYFRCGGLVVSSNSEYREFVSNKLKSGEHDIEMKFEGISIDDVNIMEAAKAAGAQSIVGFPIKSRNVLWIRFK